MKKRILLLAVSFLLLAGLVYFSNPLEIYHALLRVNPIFIFLGILFWLFGNVVRSYRWKYLLEKIDIKISLPKAMKIYTSGMFISNLSPAKTGDPVRSLILKKSEGKSFSKSLSSLFIERILDIVCLVIFSIIGFLLLAASSKIIAWLFLAIGIYAFAIIFLTYLIISRKIDFFLRKLISVFSFIPKIKKLEKKTEYFSKRMSSSLLKYNSKKSILFSMGLSILIWAIEAVISVMSFYSIGFEISYITVIAVMSAGALLSILTFLPGGLGSGEIIGVGLYSVFINLSIPEITTAILINRLMSFWMYVIVGAILLSLLKTKTSADKS